MILYVILSKKDLIPKVSSKSSNGLLRENLVMQDFNDPLFDDGNADDSVDQTIRPIDQAVLNLLRRHGSLTIQDLIEQLSVTATAVRQRLDRLESAFLRFLNSKS